MEKTNKRAASILALYLLAVILAVLWFGWQLVVVLWIVLTANNLEEKWSNS